MPRATDELVRGIIDIDASVTDLTPFIAASAAVVEAQCATISESTGTLVETWLAAHYVAIRDMRVSSEGVSGVQQSFQYKLGLGLQCTMYGQTAMSLDDTGGLAKWNNDMLKGKSGKTPSVSWAGKDPEA